MPNKLSGTAAASPGNTDARLLAGARAGDHSAWNELVERYTPTLWHAVRSHHLRHSDAADVVQETWLKLVENLDRLREPERVAGWLSTTCRIAAQRTLEKNARHVSADTSDPAATPATMPDSDTTADPVEAVPHKN
jgi:RNA polymerase sigma factor (sigma-70 family)